MTAKPITAAKHTRTGLSAREFFAKPTDGKRVSDAAREARISYSALRRHVVYGHPISPTNAERLEAWSKAEISAVKALGLKTAYAYREGR